MLEENIDFEVALEQIKLESGKVIPNKKAVVRKDSEQVLGVVANNYELTPHRTVVDIFDNIDLLEREKVSLCKGGAVMFANYGFKGGNISAETEVAVGDAVRFSLYKR